MEVANYCNPEKVKFLIKEAQESFTNEQCKQFLNERVQKTSTSDTGIKKGMTALDLATRYEHCGVCYGAKQTMKILEGAF
jgi:hypothetical protein